MDMQKITKPIFAIASIGVGAIASMSDVSAIGVSPSDIPNQTYVIGTQMFTRDKNLPEYPGYITTKGIMLSARTIEGNKLSNMNIYYKTTRGVWTDGVTGQQIEIPESFEIYDVNMGSGPVDTMAPQVLQILERIKAEREAHPELTRLGPTDFVNTYPWKNDCPQKNGTYATYYNGKPLGGYVCKSVSYVAWKAYEEYGVAINWGNANRWVSAATTLKYRIDKIPSARTIGQTNGGQYGHVFWVESVNQDGSVNVTEYDNVYSTFTYSGISQGGDFGARVMTAIEAANFNYIHLE